MNNPIPDPVWHLLACPYCGGDLIRTDRGAACTGCQEEYRYSGCGQLDLRLRRTKVCQLTFNVRPDPGEETDFDFDLLRENTNAEVDFSGLKGPLHLSRELLSYLPRARSERAYVLDLGCGQGVHRAICQKAGFEYLGLDCDSECGAICGDGHALPFKPSSFEFVFSIATLQYMHNPFLVASEVHRVLKPGGRFMGTVSFLEPFHGTYYHCTHQGIFNTLSFAGFRVEHIAPNPRWSGLLALASMGNGLFPRIPRRMAKTLVLPLEMLHRLWWKLRQVARPAAASTPAYRMMCNTGSFTFIANKK